MHPRELASSICGTLKNAGFQAFLVGGCVRDLLLKLAPADYDVATSATPDEVLRLFPDGVAVWAPIRGFFFSPPRLEGGGATFPAANTSLGGRPPEPGEISSSPGEGVQRRGLSIHR